MFSSYCKITRKDKRYQLLQMVQSINIDGFSILLKVVILAYNVTSYTAKPHLETILKLRSSHY